MLALGPEAQADAGRRPARPTGALLGARAADALDEQRVDAALRVKPRDAREAAVNHDTDSINRQRSLRHVGAHDDFSRLVACHCGVLFVRWQFAVQRQHHEIPTHARRAHRRDRARDFIRTGHEDEHVPLRVRREPFEFAGRRIPHWELVRANRAIQIFHFDGERPAFARERAARREIFLEQIRVERRGHHDEAQVGPPLLLQVQRAGERDVPVEMTLVEFIEQDCRHTAQVRVTEHPAQQHALSDEHDPCLRRRHAVEPDLVANFVAEGRSEERRVGKECEVPCRSRWSPYH